jgi:hypothetical protein
MDIGVTELGLVEQSEDSWVDGENRRDAPRRSR